MAERFVTETRNNSTVVSLAHEKRLRAEQAFEVAKGLLDAAIRKVSLLSVPDSHAQAVYEGAQEAVRVGVQPRRFKHSSPRR